MQSDTKQLVQNETGDSVMLVMAELTNGQVNLFGVAVQAITYEDALEQLARTMDRDQGRRFVHAIDMQMMVRVQVIQCPKCGQITGLGAGKCQHCGLLLDSPEMQQQMASGTIRMFPQVSFQPKALADGTENMYKIRPEHIISYDVVPPDSPAYKHWAKSAQQARDRMRQMRTGLVMPTAGETISIQQAKGQQKKQ